MATRVLVRVLLVFGPAAAQPVTNTFADYFLYNTDPSLAGLGHSLASSAPFHALSSTHTQNGPPAPVLAMGLATSVGATTSVVDLTSEGIDFNAAVPGASAGVSVSAGVHTLTHTLMTTGTGAARTCVNASVPLRIMGLMDSAAGRAWALRAEVPPWVLSPPAASPSELGAGTWQPVGLTRGPMTASNYAGWNVCVQSHAVSVPSGVFPASMPSPGASPTAAASISVWASMLVPGAAAWVAVLELLPAAWCPLNTSAGVPAPPSAGINTSAWLGTDPRLRLGTQLDASACVGDEATAVRSNGSVYYTQVWMRTQIIPPVNESISGLPNTAFGTSVACSADLCAVGDPWINRVFMYARRSAVARSVLSGEDAASMPVANLTSQLGFTNPVDGSAIRALTDDDYNATALGLYFQTLLQRETQNTAWVAVARVEVTNTSGTSDGAVPPSASGSDTVRPPVSGPREAGGWEFGFSVRLGPQHMVIGAPGAGVFDAAASGITRPGATIGSGMPGGGAVFVYDLPDAMRAAAAWTSAVFPHGGGPDASLVVRSGAVTGAMLAQPPPGRAWMRGWTFRFLCRMASDYAGSALGTAVALDTSPRGDSVTVLAGAPRANRVGVVVVSVAARTCTRDSYWNAFRTGSELDAGSSVTSNLEAAYFGSPTAAFGVPGMPGRLYAKTYCFLHRYIMRATNSPIRWCTACPTGRFSSGGESLPIAGVPCSACNTALLPAGASWLPSAGCAYACGLGLFGPACAPCSVYMASQDAAVITNASAGLTLLPPNAQWVDTANLYTNASSSPSLQLGNGVPVTMPRLCMWACVPGYTLNTSAVQSTVATDRRTYAIALQPGVSPATACLPPPPPGPVMAIAVLGLPQEQASLNATDDATGNAITATAVSVMVLVPPNPSATLPMFLRTELTWNTSRVVTNAATNTTASVVVPGTQLTDIPFSAASPSWRCTGLDASQLRRLERALLAETGSDLATAVVTSTIAAGNSSVPAQACLVRLSGLLGATRYRVRMAACNAGGCGPFSPGAPRAEQVPHRVFDTAWPAAPLSPGSPGTAPLLVINPNSGATAVAPASLAASFMNLTWSMPADTGGGEFAAIEVCIARLGPATRSGCDLAYSAALPGILNASSLASYYNACDALILHGPLDTASLLALLPPEAGLARSVDAGIGPRASTTSEEVTRQWQSAWLAAVAAGQLRTAAATCNVTALNTSNLPDGAVRIGGLTTVAVDGTACIPHVAALLPAAATVSPFGSRFVVTTSSASAASLAPANVRVVALRAVDGKLLDGSAVIVKALQAASCYGAAVRMATRVVQVVDAGSGSPRENVTVFWSPPSSPSGVWSTRFNALVPSAVTPTWWVDAVAVQNASVGAVLTVPVLRWGVACRSINASSIQVEWGVPADFGGVDVSYTVTAASPCATALADSSYPTSAVADAEAVLFALDAPSANVSQWWQARNTSFDRTIVSSVTVNGSAGLLTRSAVLSALYGGCRYAIRVTAWNAAGTSAPSDTVMPLGHCTTTTAVSPDAPVLQVAAATASSVTLRVSPPRNHGGQSSVAATVSILYPLTTIALGMDGSSGSIYNVSLPALGFAAVRTTALRTPLGNAYNGSSVSVVLSGLGARAMVCLAASIRDVPGALMSSNASHDLYHPWMAGADLSGSALCTVTPLALAPSQPGAPSELRQGVVLLPISLSSACLGAVASGSFWSDFPTAPLWMHPNVNPVAAATISQVQVRWGASMQDLFLIINSPAAFQPGALQDGGGGAPDLQLVRNGTLPSACCGVVVGQVACPLLQLSSAVQRLDALRRAAAGWALLRWTPPSDCGGAPITAYVVEQSVDGITFVRSNASVILSAYVDALHSDVGVFVDGASQVAAGWLNTNSSWLSFVSRLQPALNTLVDVAGVPTPVAASWSNVTASGDARTGRAAAAPVVPSPRPDVIAFVSELSASTAYFFRVSAVSAGGVSRSSAAALALTTGPVVAPLPPLQASLDTSQGSSGIGSGWVALRWPAPLDAGGIPPSSLRYRVYALVQRPATSWVACDAQATTTMILPLQSQPLLLTALNTSWVPLLVTDPGQLAVRVVGLRACNTYAFAVTSVGSAGQESALASRPLANITIPVAGPPAPPASKDVIVDGLNASAVAVTWSNVGDDGGAPITGYDVQAASVPLDGSMRAANMSTWTSLVFESITLMPANCSAPEVPACRVTSAFGGTPNVERVVVGNLRASSIIVVRVVARNVAGWGLPSVVPDAVCVNAVVITGAGTALLVDQVSLSSLSLQGCPAGISRAAVAPSPPRNVRMSRSGPPCGAGVNVTTPSVDFEWDVPSDFGGVAVSAYIALISQPTLPSSMSGVPLLAYTNRSAVCGMPPVVEVVGASSPYPATRASSPGVSVYSLASNTAYTIRVVAVNPAGFSQLSDPLQFVTANSTRVTALSMNPFWGALQQDTSTCAAVSSASAQPGHVLAPAAGAGDVILGLDMWSSGARSALSVFSSSVRRMVPACGGAANASCALLSLLATAANGRMFLQPLLPVPLGTPINVSVTTLVASSSTVRVESGAPLTSPPLLLVTTWAWRSALNSTSDMLRDVDSGQAVRAPDALVLRWTPWAPPNNTVSIRLVVHVVHSCALGINPDSVLSVVDASWNTSELLMRHEASPTIFSRLGSPPWQLTWVGAPAFTAGPSISAAALACAQWQPGVDLPPGQYSTELTAQLADGSVRVASLTLTGNTGTSLRRSMLLTAAATPALQLPGSVPALSSVPFSSLRTLWSVATVPPFIVGVSPVANGSASVRWTWACWPVSATNDTCADDADVQSVSFAILVVSNSLSRVVRFVTLGGRARNVSAAAASLIYSTLIIGLPAGRLTFQVAPHHRSSGSVGAWSAPVTQETDTTFVLDVMKEAAPAVATNVSLSLSSNSRAMLRIDSSPAVGTAVDVDAVLARVPLASVLATRVAVYGISVQAVAGSGLAASGVVAAQATALYADALPQTLSRTNASVHALTGGAWSMSWARQQWIQCARQRNTSIGTPTALQFALASPPSLWSAELGDGVFDFVGDLGNLSSIVMQEWTGATTSVQLRYAPSNVSAIVAVAGLSWSGACIAYGETALASTAPRPAGPVAAPTPLHATSTQLTVSWTLPDDSGGLPVRGFVLACEDLTASAHRMFSLTATANASLYQPVVGGLVAATRYRCRLLVVTAPPQVALVWFAAASLAELVPLQHSDVSLICGMQQVLCSDWSEWSLPQSTNAAVPPAAPRNLRLPGTCITSTTVADGGPAIVASPLCGDGITASSVVLEWDALLPSDTGGIPLLEYRVYIMSGTLPSTTLGSPLPGINATGNALPGMFVSAALTAGLTSATMNALTTAAVASPAVPVTVSVGCDTRIRLVGLRAGTLYTFAVSAANAAGASAMSPSPVRVLTAAASVPSAPDMLSIVPAPLSTSWFGVPASSSVLLLWRMPVHGGGGALSHVILAASASGSSDSGMVSVLSATDCIVAGDVVTRLLMVNETFPAVADVRSSLDAELSAWLTAQSPTPVLLSRARFGAALVRSLDAATSWTFTVHVVAEAGIPSVPSRAVTLTTAPVTAPTGLSRPRVVSSGASTVLLDVLAPMELGGAAATLLTVFASSDGVRWDTGRTRSLSGPLSVRANATSPVIPAGVRGYPSGVSGAVSGAVRVFDGSSVDIPLSEDGYSTHWYSGMLLLSVSPTAGRSPLAGVACAALCTTAASLPSAVQQECGCPIAGANSSASLSTAKRVMATGDGDACMLSAMWASASVDLSHGVLAMASGDLTAMLPWLPFPRAPARLPDECILARVMVTNLVASAPYSFRATLGRNASNDTGAAVLGGPWPAWPSTPVQVVGTAAPTQAVCTNRSEPAAFDFTLSRVASIGPALMLQPRALPVILPATAPAPPSFTAYTTMQQPPGPIELLQIESVAPTSVVLSWQPPLDTGGAYVQCYRVEVAVDGLLAGDASCDVVARFSGLNASSGYVLSLFPAPRDAAGAALFPPAAVPASSAWMTTAWPAVNASTPWPLQPPVAAVEMPAFVDAAGAVRYFDYSLLVTATGMTPAVSAVLRRADAYGGLALPFGWAFNSTARLRGSIASNFTAVTCVAAPTPTPQSVQDTIGAVALTLPLVNTSAAAPFFDPVVQLPRRVRTTVTVPANAVVRLRVAAVAAALAPKLSTQPSSSQLDTAVAFAAGRAPVTQQRRLHVTSPAPSSVPTPSAPPAAHASRQPYTAVRMAAAVPSPLPAKRGARLQVEVYAASDWSDAPPQRLLQATPSRSPSRTRTPSASAPPSRTPTRSVSPSPSPSPSATPPPPLVYFVPVPATALATFSLSARTADPAAAPNVLIFTPVDAISTPSPPVVRSSNSTGFVLGVAVPTPQQSVCSPTLAQLTRSAFLSAAAQAAAWLAMQPPNSTTLPPTFVDTYGAEVVVWRRDDVLQYPFMNRSSMTPLLSKFTPQAFDPQPLLIPDGGLVRASQYRYRWQIGTSAGWTSPSAPLSATTQPSLAGPPATLRVFNVTPVAGQVAWLPPFDDGGRPVLGYRVDVVAAAWNDSQATLRGMSTSDVVLASDAGVPVPPASAWRNVASLDGNALGATALGLAVNSWVLVRVAAITEFGTGIWTPALLFRTLDPLPCAGLPDPFSNVSAPSLGPVGPAPGIYALIGSGRCSGRGSCHPWAGTCSCQPHYASSHCMFVDGVVLDVAVSSEQVANAQAPAFLQRALRDAAAAELAAAGDTRPLDASRIILVAVLTPPPVANGSRLRRRLTSSNLLTKPPSPQLGANVWVLRVRVRMTAAELPARTTVTMSAYLASSNVSAATMLVPAIVSVPMDPQPPTASVAGALLSAAARGSTPLRAVGASAVQLLGDGSAGSGLQPTALTPVDNCALFSSCGTCIASAFCGWCASTGRCLLGFFDGPTYAACPAFNDVERGLVPAYFNRLANTSSQAVCPVECRALSDCGQCTARADCGWCEDSQACFASSELAGGVACGNDTSGRVKLTLETQCPSARCPRHVSRWLCTGDPYCAYCDQSGPGTPSFCAAGNSFGFTHPATPRCSGVYQFRSTSNSCPFRASEIHDCDACIRRPNCGWCASQQQCGFGDGNAPALGSCADGQWFTAVPGFNNVCPPRAPSPREQCAAASTCGSCLSLASSIGCAMCDPSVTASTGSPQCMLLGDALGYAEPDAPGAGTCGAVAQIRATNAVHPYRNGTLLRPAQSTLGCTTQCLASVPLSDATGTLQFGSAGDPRPDPVLTVYRPPPSGSTCSWLICPLDLQGNSSNAIAWPQVQLAFAAWDLQQGDTIIVSDGVTARTPQSTIVTIRAASAAGAGPMYVTVGVPCARVELIITSGGGGRGFRMSWAGQRAASTDLPLLWVMLIVGVIVGGFLLFFASIRFTKCMLRRAGLWQDPRNEDEVVPLAEQQAQAQRTGRGATKQIIMTFPAFVYDAAKLAQTPLFKAGEGAAPDASAAAANNAAAAPPGGEVQLPSPQRSGAGVAPAGDAPTAATSAEHIQADVSSADGKPCGPDIECAICLADFSDGDEVRALLCGHGYHVACIDQWLALNKVCPMCKRDVQLMFVERMSIRDAGIPDPMVCGPGIRLLPQFMVDPEVVLNQLQEEASDAVPTAPDRPVRNPLSRRAPAVEHAAARDSAQVANVIHRRQGGRAPGSRSRVVPQPEQAAVPATARNARGDNIISAYRNPMMQRVRTPRNRVADAPVHADDSAESPDEDEQVSEISHGSDADDTEDVLDNESVPDRAASSRSRTRTPRNQPRRRRSVGMAVPVLHLSTGTIPAVGRRPPPSSRRRGNAVAAVASSLSRPVPARSSAVVVPVGIADEPSLSVQNPLRARAPEPLSEPAVPASSRRVDRRDAGAIEPDTVTLSPLLATATPPRRASEEDIVLPSSAVRGATVV